MTTEYCLIWTHVCSTSDTWAAWAQAIFSVLAIVVAIWVPTGMAKAARKDRFYAVVYLIAAVSSRTMDLTRPFAERRIAEGSIGRDEELNRLIAALQAIPTHDLPEAGLIAPLLESTRYAEDFQRAYAEATEFGDLPSAAWDVQYGRLLRIARKVTDQLVFCDRMGRYLYGNPLRRWMMRRERKSHG